MNELGLFYKISYLAKPLISFSHLPAVSASTFVVSLGSALAANTMIARMKDEGSLTERQAFFCAIMNSVPVYFRELFTYHLAFVVPVLGLFAGGIYAIVALSTGIIKLFIVVILGRAYLPEGSDASKDADIPENKTTIFQAVLRSLNGQGRLFLRISSLFFIMTFLVLYLSEKGILQSIARYTADNSLEMLLYNLNEIFAINSRVKNFVAPPDTRLRFTDVTVE